MPKIATKNAQAPRKAWTPPPLVEPDEGDFILTHSEIEAFRQCPLKHYLAYNQKWVKQGREDDHPLSKGILWHDVMEQHYLAIQEYQQGTPTKARFDAMIDRIARELDRLLWNGPEQTELQALVWWMYRGYIEKYGYDVDWEILGVEVKFQARLDGPDGPSRFLLKGKLDLVVKDRRSGKIWIVDHKSGQNLPDQMELDIADQFTLYSWLLRQAGIEVIGVIHSGAVTRQNQGDLDANWDGDKPLKANIKRQTLDQRFRRTLLSRGVRELDNVAREAWSIAGNIRPDLIGRTPLPPYSSPDPRQCGWKCDFLEAHLMARKGRNITSALTQMGFVQITEERY